MLTLRQILKILKRTSATVKTCAGAQSVCHVLGGASPQTADAFRFAASNACQMLRATNGISHSSGVAVSFERLDPPWIIPTRFLEQIA